MFSIAVKKDEDGLYIIAEGMIFRSPENSVFKEGDNLYVYECEKGDEVEKMIVTIDFETHEVWKKSGEFYEKTLFGRSLRRGIRG